MKQSKEQLVIELAKIRESHEGWVAGDESHRREFAKAFAWYKKSAQFDYGERDIRTPTWPEIYVELGKILACRDFRNLEGKVSDLEMMIRNIEQKITPEEIQLKRYE